MFTQLLVTSTLVLSLAGVKPPHYSEKGLCDLWAGARCYATSCEKDAKLRCTSEASQCRGRTEASVPDERAERVAACARRCSSRAAAIPPLPNAKASKARSRSHPGKPSVPECRLIDARKFRAPLCGECRRPLAGITAPVFGAACACPRGHQ